MLLKNVDLLHESGEIEQYAYFRFERIFKYLMVEPIAKEQAVSL